jgi:iron complex outermembrane receptor protein
MAFRMPTFTDLFYKSPTQEGNQGLKPEKTQSLRIGAQYNSLIFSLSTSFFYDWGTDMIDWVMYNASDKYHSANFSLDNRGYEINVAIRPLAGKDLSQLTIRLGYAYIDQKRKDDVYIYKSNYAMEYLRHKFIAGIDHPIVSHLSASWSFRWQQRMGSYLVYESAKSTGEIKPYAPYGLLDLKILWTKPHYDISLSLNNLTSHRYYDLGNVQQPGFWLMAAAKYKF